jgi:uncharacterized protein
MFNRLAEKEIKTAFSMFPAVAIVGPRQIGKTTLAMQFSEKTRKKTLYLDLELNSHYKRLEENAEDYLILHQDKLVIIDEVQRLPMLFSLLRALIDMKRTNGRFLLLGSSSPELIKGVNESLAGRLAYVNLGGINLKEALQKGFTQRDLWIKGGFPSPLQTKDNKKIKLWYANLVNTYIQRDLNELFGINLTPVLIRKIWTILASNNGGMLNQEKLSNSVGTSATTVKRYMHYLEGAFLITVLQPWFANVTKRLVKMPKVYIRDTGILHYFSGISTMDDLLSNIHAGDSWESFAIEQIKQARQDLEYYFYRTHQDAEADLVIVKNNKPVCCIEFKINATANIKKGFYQVMEDLKTVKNYLIYPEGDVFPYKKNITASNLEHFILKIMPKI